MTRTPFTRLVLVILIGIGVVLVPWGLGIILIKLVDQPDPLELFSGFVSHWLLGALTIAIVIGVHLGIYHGSIALYHFIKDGE